MDIKKSNRRSFLKSFSTTSLAMFSTFSPLRQSYTTESPNERFKLGFIGCGGMGTWDAHELSEFGDMVAVCDVDLNHAEACHHNSSVVRKPDECFVTQDYRRLLERDDIEVVGIATPDHWHVKIGIEALLAGKHVFCQKPLTLTIEENKLIRRAVKKTGKVFQVGTQQRLMKDRFMLSTLMVRRGLIGDVKRVTVFLNTGPQGGPFNVQPIPETLDWNMFLGQTAYVEYRPQRATGSFRYWYEYSGGQFTDWGAHHIDCALWALNQLGQGRGPIEFDGREVIHGSPLNENGYPIRDDCYNTAVNFNITAKFANGVKMFIKDKKGENGILFEGTDGKLFVDRGRITGKPIEENRHLALTEEEFIELNKYKPIESHKANFFRCIREGGLPASDVFSHTYSMNTCHLCGIAARLKRIITWNPNTETIIGDEKAASFISREQRKGFEIPNV